MVNSSNLPNNYTVTEQATSLAAVRVSAQDGARTHDRPLLGCGLWVTSPEGVNCPAVWTTTQNPEFSLATFGITITKY